MSVSPLVLYRRECFNSVLLRPCSGWLLFVSHWYFKLNRPTFSFRYFFPAPPQLDVWRQPPLLRHNTDSSYTTTPQTIRSYTWSVTARRVAISLTSCRESRVGRRKTGIVKWCTVMSDRLLRRLGGWVKQQPRQTDRAFSTAPSGIRHCAWRAGVPGGSSRHAAAAVCRTSPANYCTVRAHDGPASGDTTTTSTTQESIIPSPPSDCFL